MPSIRALGPHAGLFSLLTLATFFEGFDTKLASLVQPVIGRDFGVSTEALGMALGISSLGMVLAFFFVHLADSIGRRPVFLAALGSYTLFTLLTALAPSLVVFTALQLFARMAMVVELGLAYIMLSEALPPEIRGRANGFLGAFAALGAAAPLALLAPLEAVGLGWRGLFLIGGLPLLLFPLYWRGIEETGDLGERRARPARSRLAEEAALFRSLVSKAHRSRLAAITALWLTINLWSGTALYFLTIYAFDERGWEPADLTWLPLGTIPFGFAGYALSGFAMDRLGRRGATTLYLGLAFGSTLLCYQSSDAAAIRLGWFSLVGLGGIWTIASTWTAELFPTEVRGTALGVGNNLFGRLGLVLGPILAGRLSVHWGSIGDAITALSTVTLLCLPVVWWVLPETKGVVLRRSGPGDGQPPDI
ncbi:MAG TPA: MFS transporter [Myxococcota bacterium]|nr:MFS transporter [Myxococcota bacterium]